MTESCESCAEFFDEHWKETSLQRNFKETERSKNSACLAIHFNNQQDPRTTPKLRLILMR